MNYSLLIPEFVLAGCAAGIVAVDLWWPQLRKDLLAYLAALAALVSLLISLAYLRTTESFSNLFQIDHYTEYFRFFFYGAAIFIALFSAQFLIKTRMRHAGEYYAILLLATIGSIGMAAGTELLTSYISLELLSFSLYVLISFNKFDAKSNEAGLKYMLLGAFSSALLLYGISLIYGATKTTNYNEIAAALQSPGSGLSFILLMGFVLIIAGIGFKIAAVPFHVATPDAYEGAPLPITAFLSITSKAAGLALLLRLFSTAFMPMLTDWRWMIAAIAAATMTFGNLVAIQQHNMKRLLAYSSIGQVGYLLIGIAAMAPDSASALLVHLAGYAITNLVVFGAVIAIYNATGKDEIPDYYGMAEREPFLSLVLTVGLFSLAGLPLFAGFFTKFLLFQAGAMHGMLWLSGFAVVNSMISLYYYLLVMKQLYLGDKSPERPRFRLSWLWNGVLGVGMIAVFFIGIWPFPLLKAADKAVSVLFAGRV